MVADKRSVRVYLSNWVDEKLREVLPARRGALSSFVEEAIIEKLEKEGVLDGNRAE